MNKAALKQIAIEAREELEDKIKLQAAKIGVTQENIKNSTVRPSNQIYLGSIPLNENEQRQRDNLIVRINEVGFEQVIDETVYTWFNRFVALRFMEVNNYLPTKVRVLSSTSEESTEPDMLKEVFSLDLDIDKEHVYELKDKSRTEELFKYLIIRHCHDLNRYMPFMFKTIEDYMLILFPEGLLRKDSFLSKMTDTEIISESTWKNVEIIGWLYQFYNAKEKDRIMKKKSKYSPEEIPIVTQLYTPNWIVRYLVQNSLGRYWIEAHPESKKLANQWEYYIDHDNKFNDKVSSFYKRNINIEDIKCFDPAMGSGHILVYMFDVLYEIYSEQGYLKHEIPRLIIEKNLYGIDIDDRAYQLAAFSIVMKALQYNRRFLRNIERKGLQLNLASIQETNDFTAEDIVFLAGEEKGNLFDEIKALIDQFKHAKSIGALLKLKQGGTRNIEERLSILKSNGANNLFAYEKTERLLKVLPKLIKQTKIMNQKYDIIVTNPPYMGSRGMNKELSSYVRKHYFDSKADLFAAFMEINQYKKENGIYAAINQHSWMFLSSYEKLRDKIVRQSFIDTMLHLGPRAFEEIGGEVVQSTAFVLRNYDVVDEKGIYIRLVDEKSPIEKKLKTLEAVQNPSVPYRYTFNQENFSKIPGSPIAYWVSERTVGIFEKTSKIGEIVEAKQGLVTANNDRFLRLWHEVHFNKIGFNKMNRIEAMKSGCKWFPYNKGGEYRKWYGNQEYIVNWKNDGEEIKQYVDERGRQKSRPQNMDYYFKESVSWSDVTSSSNSFRFYGKGFIFDSTGHSCFPNNKVDQYQLLAILNNKYFDSIIKILNPTMHFHIGYFKNLPAAFLKDVESKRIVKQNINISKNEWNSFETSWDFSKHPLLKFPASTIESSFNQWSDFAEKQFYQMKENEEELNRIFIEIYGLEEELTPDVAEEDVTVRKADLERDIKSFISYAVGCTLGRYSLDEEGLVYAGGEFDPSRYNTFPADEDNILPILPGAYFEDDIVTRLIDFVRVTFGSETLEENLEYIADAIGRRKNETAREAIRRYFLNNFYKDHVRTYKKRPIYWLFTSGKEKAFNCLIYMHRYDKTTLSRIRTDYLHDVQTRYDTIRNDLLAIIKGDSTASEIRSAKKELTSVERKIKELKTYDEKLHHMADMQIQIDLDDGVKVNYEKFKGLVAKI